MIEKLRIRLTVLFTCATGVILTLVLVTAFLYQIQLTHSHRNESFQNQVLDLTHRLEGTSTFSDDWLARLEMDGHLIIHIEDNGTPLFFSGSWTPATDRDKLIERTRAQALSEGIDTTKRPYSRTLAKSSVFSIKGDHHDTYQATALVLSTENGFRSLILLADITNLRTNMRIQFMLFLLLELFGILSLFFVSRTVVKKAVQPVEEYHQKQTEFVAAASHELRSPLALIQTSASAILTLPQRTEEMVQTIQQACSRSAALIKNLLLLSSADAGSLPSELEPLEIDELLLQIFETYEPLCITRHIQLHVSLPEEFLPKAYGNPQWIYQILSIFLDNAISYGCTKENPVIRLTAELQETSLSVSVIDYGIGIPAHIKERIFERFYRADSSRKAKEHFGLGLSIAQMLANQMGAVLTVSDTKGGGSTFQIQFKTICR